VRIDVLREYWDYYYWATWKVLGAAEGLSEAEFTGPAPGGQPLRELLVHTLSAERGWRIGFEIEERVAGLPVEDFPTIAALAERWREEEANMRAFLAGLDEAVLDRPFIDGKPLWKFLLHVANHGTQHRQEAALILTELGRSPGNLDYLFFFE
jgi:uncharacterized damage-inducible protein DinB